MPGRIEAHAAALPEGRIRLTVRDTGPGIRPEHLERVFEPFYTSKPQGLGLGRAICRSIIDAHGGRMWVTNNETRGVTFHVRLPAVADTTAPPR